MHQRIAVDLGGGGVGQGGACRPCDLEEPPRAGGVGFERLERQPVVVDRAGRRREVQHHIDIDDRCLADVARDQRERRVGKELVDVRPPSGGEIVDAHDLVVAAQQLPDDVAADEPGTTSYEDLHASVRRLVGVRATRPTPM
jgi:hypothetical protein